MNIYVHISGTMIIQQVCLCGVNEETKRQSKNECHEKSETEYNKKEQYNQIK
jgi:hypothetical protein